MIVAWIGALIIGLALGLFGSGGSILTVPVLVYLLGHEPKAAMAESLAIVGLIALAGGARQARRGMVEWRSVVWFGLPGMVGASLGALIAKYISGAVLLIVFAGLMLAASVLMLRRGETEVASAAGHRPKRSAWKVVVDGLGVGFLTGMVGAGGGFLIVPALVVLGGIPLLRAVGTSLWIIALKSAVGFATYLSVLSSPTAGEGTTGVDWETMALFAGMGIVGTFVGTAAGERLPQRALRRAFAVFLLAMAGYVVFKQAPIVLPGVFGPSPAARAPAASSEPAAARRPLNLRDDPAGVSPGRPSAGPTPAG